MQITLFGGSFDPAQKAHRLVPAALLKQKLADQVWFVPTQTHPFQKQVSASTDRVAMLELLIQSALRENATLHSDQLRIEKFELENQGTSYSYKTLTALAAQYPEHHFSWLIGSDLLASFPKWYHYQELLSQFPVFVYPRQGFLASPELLLPRMTVLQHVELVEISSTEVRQRLHSGQSISQLVDPEIELYIRKNQLYGQSPR